MLFNINRFAAFLSIALLLVTQNSFAGADYTRELRWANEVVPGIVIGEPVYITQINQHRFLAIYTEAENAGMALIIVHGMGIHPDWGLINTLRQDLADDGYTTLSIQMPVLAADATYRDYPAVFPEAVERLQLSVAYLKNKGYQRIVIVSHSNGSRMSRIYMAKNPVDVQAWAALSLTQGDTYDGIVAPVLDLFGSNDLEHVLRAGARRKASFQDTRSRQIIIHGADHFFNGHETEMVNAVSQFLNDL